jgi:peptidoglycan/xylan/chitin deacetylase (PgdA/CDA1 family)
MKIPKSLMTTPFAWEPFLKILRKSRLRGKIAVLMYHEVLENSHSSTAWTGVKQSDFVKQLTYLRDHFKVISLNEALSLMKSKVISETPHVVLTFDDGYLGNRRVVLPIIESLKIPITVFVATKAIQDQQPYWYDMIIDRLDVGLSDIRLDLTKFDLGIRIFENDLKSELRWDRIQKLLSDLKSKLPKNREEIVNSILEQTAGLIGDRKSLFMPMTVEDIRAMAASEFVKIGAHTHCHNILTQLDRSSTEKTIGTSKGLLEAWTGQKIDFFAYPNGDFNSDTISVVEKLGFVSAFSTLFRLWSKTDFIFALPRIGVGRFDSMVEFKLKVSGITA